MTQKTVIGLRGKPRSGKTSTIRLVYEQLSQEAKILREPGGRKDVWGAILEIQEVKIGINSSGDRPEDEEKWVGDLIDEGCVIIVCAAHKRMNGSHSVTEQVVIRLSEPNYIVLWIDKEQHAAAPDQKRDDRQKADRILSEVRKAIREAQLVEA